MTDIKQKAQEMLLKVQSDYPYFPPHTSAVLVLEREIEQHENTKQELSEFRREVSEFALGVREYMACCNIFGWQGECDSFIIPTPNPDPLVEIIGELDDGTWGETKAEYADRFRAALEARGLEIREKNDD